MATSAEMATEMREYDVALLEKLYETLRTARMNAIYYELRLSGAYKWHFTFEFCSAIVATGSGIAGWALWDTNVGKYAWGCIAGVASLMAIAKPIMATNKRLEQFTRQHQGWLTNYFALDKLAFQIRQEGAVTSDARRRFDTLYDHYVQLSLEDERPPVIPFVEVAQDRVASEIPPSSLWLPGMERAAEAIGVTELSGTLHTMAADREVTEVTPGNGTIDLVGSPAVASADGADHGEANEAVDQGGEDEDHAETMLRHNHVVR